MISKIRNILIFTAITAIILLPYYIFRSQNIEKKYISGIINKAEMIKPAADMLNSEALPEPGKIKKIFNEIMDKEPSAAALILTDKSGSLKYLIKNDSIIRSGGILELLMNDIKEKSFASDNNREPFTRNYKDSSGGSEKFYIYPFSSGGQRTLAVFAFRLEKKILIRLALELILLVSASFMFTGMVLSLLRKKGITEDVNVKTIVLGAKAAPSGGRENSGAAEIPADNKSRMAEQIDVNELFPAIEPGSRSSIEPHRAMSPEKESSADALNSRIFDLFKQIHRELKPESVSLYIKKMEGRLSKTYELKDKTFIRIDSSLFENIKISELDKFRRSGAHIIENGRIIRIPLIDDESLLGLIEVKLKDSGAALDLGRLQTEVKDISKDVKEFLVINNVIIDRETGFFSASYFNMRLSEQVYSAQKIGTGFFLLMIDVFRDVVIDREQMNTVLKIIYPVIKRSSGETHELFLYNGKIGIILPGTGRREAENIELAVTKDISKFRIKLSADNIIRLKPVSAVMSSSETANVKEILKETLELFKP